MQTSVQILQTSSDQIEIKHSVAVQQMNVSQEDPHLIKIRNRLDNEIPRGPYLIEDEVAKILGISKKRLQNLRAEARRSRDGAHPPHILIGKLRGVRYPRAILIDFLAKQELEALGRTVHRCY